MMSEEEIRACIVARLFTCTDSCNSYHIATCCGQIRALIAVLRDGELVPDTSNALSWLDAAKIPYTSDKDGYEVDPKWLAEHGFDEDDDHPRFTCWSN